MNNTIMKLKKYLYGVALGTLSIAYTSCYNSENDFPDYQEGTTAYFAYQSPVRTLILGNDNYDNTLDNAHKCRIWATMGGAYGGRDAYADIVVADTLCDNLWFVDAGGNPSTPVLPMPKEYYNLLDNKSSLILILFVILNLQNLTNRNTNICETNIVFNTE